jgi:hypothetical protein
MGISDLEKIEVIGENLKEHIKQYKLNDSFEKQGAWMNPKS